MNDQPEKIANAGMSERADTLTFKQHLQSDPLMVEGFWYLATPYSKYVHGLWTANVDACWTAAQLMKRGVNVFAPIPHCHSIAAIGDLDPRDNAFWLPQLKPLLDAAHGLLVVEMPGWRESAGVAHEIAASTALKKPIYYLTWRDLKVVPFHE